MLHLYPLQSILHDAHTSLYAAVLACEKLCLPGRSLCHAHMVLSLTLEMCRRLRDLAFCQHVLDNMAARSEFK